MGTTYILAAVLAFTGVLPFSVLTSVIVAYGMAGEMVKLAETNLLSEWDWWAGPRQASLHQAQGRVQGRHAAQPVMLVVCVPGLMGSTSQPLNCPVA